MAAQDRAARSLVNTHGRIPGTHKQLYLDELTRAGITRFGHDEFRAALAAAASQLLARCPVAHQIPSPNERASTMRARMFRGYFDIATYAGLGDLL